MHGSLCFHQGILYVGRHALTAHVRPYDFDGHPLGPGFSFRGIDGGRAEVSGLAVDLDHRLWIADGAAGAVRSFTQFGRELAGIPSALPAEKDVAGHLARVADVATAGVEDEARLLVASGGDRRHALHLYTRGGALLSSLRPLGDPLGRFLGLTGVALLGRMVYACEAGAGRVQVFRDGDFHFALRLDGGPGATTHLRPLAAAPLEDGRVVVAHGGESASGVVLLDGSGRQIRRLAPHGTEIGHVFEPTDVAVDPGGSDRDALVAVIDCDAERVQVFTLDGRCHGAFVELPAAGAPIAAATCLALRAADRPGKS